MDYELNYVWINKAEFFFLFFLFSFFFMVVPKELSGHLYLYLGTKIDFEAYTVRLGNLPTGKAVSIYTPLFLSLLGNLFRLCVDYF